jgi:hypothetical protein
VLKSKGKTCMAEEPSHVKQLSLNHVNKIGLKGEGTLAKGPPRFCDIKV